MKSNLVSKIKPRVFPHCGVEHDTIINASSDGVAPQDGDIAVCGDCAGISIYVGPKELRAATHDEMMEVYKDPLVRDAVLTIMRIKKL